MTAVRAVAVAGVAVVAAGAAWRVALASPPKVIEIRVPEPTPAPPPPPRPGAPGTIGPDGQPIPDAAVSTVGGGRGRAVGRSEPREVKGEAPGTLWGRYEIVQVTTDGETEDFKIKMDREGKALELDCITVRRVFDFGPVPASPGLPAAVMLSEQQVCTKGGLGRYANELTVVLPATWSTSDAGLVLTLPSVEASASLVRVRRPDPDDLSAPPHWLGPKSTIERPEATYQVVAELPKPKPVRAGQEPPPPDPALAVHLVPGAGGDGMTYHLEPEPADGPFGR